MRGQLRADAGDRDQQLPLPRRNGARDLGGFRVPRPDREMVLVAPALAAKPVRIVDADIERCLFLPVRIAEVDGDAMNAGWHSERHEEMCVVLGDGYVALKHKIRLLYLSLQWQAPGRGGQEQKTKGFHHGVHLAQFL